MLAPAAAAVAGPISDTGLAAQIAPALVSTTTTPLAAGVTGVLKDGDSEPLVDTPVQAMAQGDGVIYVGGKFANVVRPDGTTGAQSYLAAFDDVTGAWIPSFAPTLDGTVWDLAVAPNGNLIVAGQFTNVSGAAHTAGLAMLDPRTGAVISSWRADAIVTGTTARPLVRAIDIEGPWLYVGGNFTRLTGPNGIAVPEGRLGRVAVATVAVDKAFRPDITGVVYDIDATPDRVYAVGKFTRVNGVAQVAVAQLDPDTGLQLPGMQPPVLTDASKSRQLYFAVLELGDHVWLGGSQHTTQVYRRSDFSLVRSFVASPNGDGQALATSNGFLYTGNHSNDMTRLYSDAISWPDLAGATGSAPITWIGAWDDATAVFQSWVPDVGTDVGEGTWDLLFDRRGCMWAGGDFNRGSVIDGVTTFAQGMVRFCPRDQQAPSVPASPTAASAATGVTLGWNASNDDQGVVGYELFRNDALIATTITGTSYVDPDGAPGDRYFVRAYDAVGNRGATTRVIVAPALPRDTTAPSTPANLSASVNGSTVVLSWSAATDDTGVVGYTVQRNGVTISTVTSTTLTVSSVPVGDSVFTVTALDAAANASTPASVNATVVAPPPPVDTAKPSVPAGLQSAVALDGSVTISWAAATDNVGVTGYVVVRNGVELTRTAQTSTVVRGLGIGTWTFQVQAFDLAGNTSVRSVGLDVVIAPPPPPPPPTDTAKPTAPTGLVGTNPSPGVVTLSWNPARDNVGVTGYTVLRNGIEIGQSATTSITVTDQPTAVTWYQVTARDAAGNVSVRTSPVAITVLNGPDVTAPNAPGGLNAAIGVFGEVVLGWNASTDNLGVTSYAVLRNGVEITTVPGTAASITGLPAGTWWFQVVARDAAGNSSVRTAPVQITTTDHTAPTVPGVPVATIDSAGGLVLTWTAATDDLAVTAYAVFIDGVEVQRVPALTATVIGLAAGDHLVEIRAVDAAGNLSLPSPLPVTI